MKLLTSNDYLDILQSFLLALEKKDFDSMSSFESLVWSSELRVTWIDLYYAENCHKTASPAITNWVDSLSFPYCLRQIYKITPTERIELERLHEWVSADATVTTNWKEFEWFSVLQQLFENNKNSINEAVVTHWLSRLDLLPIYERARAHSWCKYQSKLNHFPLEVKCDSFSDWLIQISCRLARATSTTKKSDPLLIFPTLKF